MSSATFPWDCCSVSCITVMKIMVTVQLGESVKTNVSLKSFERLKMVNNTVLIKKNVSDHGGFSLWAVYLKTPSGIFLLRIVAWSITLLLKYLICQLSSVLKCRTD